MEQERLAVCAPRRCARIFLATTLIALAAALPARAAEVGWGLAAGYPQVFAVVAETPQHGPLRMQFSVSPMIFMNSMTARAILSPLTTRLRPYAFLGAGILNTNEGDGGGAVGTTGFFWVGGGAKLRFSKFDLFAELGGLSGMDTSKGYDDSSVGGAVGLLFSTK